jgi:8-oxo-dGTP pyrophosphatase MutT (NUDIX family)
VLLLDESDRILLFRHEGVFRVGNTAGEALWAPPGGGLEDGETHEAAAHRELWEETGLKDAELGACVWLRDLVFTWNGIEFDSRERYFVCRTRAFDVDVSNQAAQERLEMTAFRWWTREEIAVSEDLFVPRDLANLLSPILLDEYPDEPLRVEI